MNGIMRNWVLALAAFVLGATVVLAQQDRPWGEKIFPLKDPKSKERDLSYDFGNVAYGSQVMHGFPMTNPYAVPLEISTRTSCVCITAVPKPAVLGPKQTGQSKL